MMGEDQQSGVRACVIMFSPTALPSQPVLSTCYGVDINIRLRGKKGGVERGNRKQNFFTKSVRESNLNLYI